MCLDKLSSAYSTSNDENVTINQVMMSNVGITCKGLCNTVVKVFDI